MRGYLDFLLGSRRELQPVWREYGFAPQTKTQEHNSYVVLIDGDGRQRVGFPVRATSRRRRSRTTSSCCCARPALSY